jgi:hypothetical protein
LKIRTGTNRPLVHFYSLIIGGKNEQAQLFLFCPRLQAQAKKPTFAEQEPFYRTMEGHKEATRFRFNLADLPIDSYEDIDSDGPEPVDDEDDV